MRTDSVPMHSSPGTVWLKARDGGLVEVPSLEPMPTATPFWRRLVLAAVRVIDRLLERVLRHVQHVGAP